ncbi:MAG: cation transporter [Candidatus Dormibacteraeota bacterium]|nr:cation transporter [Candidatus Dormibacteraeota bacterium]
MAEHAPHEHVHTHALAPHADRRRVVFALGLILAFMVLEVVLGVLANSLALLSDAGHMLTDALALVMSLVVMRLAVRRPGGAWTYGLRRTEILSGLVSGISLLVIAGVVAVEGVQRLVSPPVVEARLVLPVALIGIGVNLLATWQLARARRQSLNIRGSLQHLLTDLYGFIGTALAAVIILSTGFMRADALASLLVAAIMVRTGLRLVREAGSVLLEAAPQGFDADQVAAALRAHRRVVNLHDFHLWEITSDMPALSAHVLVAPGEDCHEVRRQLEHTLQHDFHIDHTTLQVDHAGESEQLITPVRHRATPG